MNKEMISISRSLAQNILDNLIESSEDCLTQIGCTKSAIKEFKKALEMEDLSIPLEYGYTVDSIEEIQQIIDNLLDEIPVILQKKEHYEQIIKEFQSYLC